MKIMLAVGLTIASFLFSSTVLAKDCDANCQLSQIESYFSALDKISRVGSTIGDVDSLLALTHADVKYIHVEYEANFNKVDWRKAFIRNLERGAYRKGKENEMRIMNSIFGKNYTAIEYSHGVIQQDGAWQPTESLLVLFGFTDKKISLVKELW